MRAARNKAVCIILILFVIFGAMNFTSCNRKYDEEEILSVVKILLKDAELLNKVYFGSGIEYFDTDEGSTGYYRKANPEHLKKLGFSTIEELKTLTRKTFSKEYSEQIYSTILSPVVSDIGVVSAARYYQATNEETGEPTDIMVYSIFNLKFRDTVVYDYDSFEVEGAKKEKVIVTVKASVTNSEGKSQETVIRIMLVEEEEGWRIDNPTYANYNEMKDRYDELNNQDFK